MGDLIDLEARRQEAQPHVRGEAICRACGHEWQAVVPHNPQGDDPNVKLQCPTCLRHLGIFKFEYAPTGELVKCCGTCQNQLFYLTRAGVFCPRCGRYESHG